MAYDEQHRNTADDTAPDTPQMRHGRRLRKGEILSGITDYVRAWFSAHNEVTRVTHAGARIVRYRDTDILWVAPSGLAFRLDNGGAPLADVARHMTGALGRLLPAGTPAPRVSGASGQMQLWAPQLPHHYLRFSRSLEATYRDGVWHAQPDGLIAPVPLK